jgi:Flp pilus assembly protein TadD
LQPPFPPALFSGGHFFLSQNDYRRARECFSLYCEIAEDRDKIQQARDILREIKDSGLDDESFREAYDFIRQGKAQEGLMSIRDFLERYPLVWKGWFILGWALRLLGRWTDGEAAFRKAIELDGGNSDTRNELAICLMETGNFPGARRELEIALGEDPENIKIISNLGMLAVKNGKPDEAAAFFRIVLELDGNDPVAKKYLEGGA